MILPTVAKSFSNGWSTACREPIASNTKALARARFSKRAHNLRKPVVAAATPAKVEKTSTHQGETEGKNSAGYLLFKTGTNPNKATKRK